jgi:DNA-binding MarR family transcriptional regulator
LPAEIKSSTRASGIEDNMDPNNNYRLWSLFFTAESSMSRVRDLELAAIGVTREQSGALFLLVGRGQSTIVEMANAWCRRRNSVSTLMERMEKQGLVKKVKVPNQKDLVVFITPKGREMHHRVLSTSNVIDIILNQFSEEDRQDFVRCLRMILSRSRNILNDDEKIYQPLMYEKTTAN